MWLSIGIIAAVGVCLAVMYSYWARKDVQVVNEAMEALEKEYEELERQLEAKYRNVDDVGRKK